MTDYLWLRGQPQPESYRRQNTTMPPGDFAAYLADVGEDAEPLTAARIWRLLGHDPWDLSHLAPLISIAGTVPKGGRGARNAGKAPKPKKKRKPPPPKPRKEWDELAPGTRKRLIRYYQSHVSIYPVDALDETGWARRTKKWHKETTAAELAEATGRAAGQRYIAEYDRAPAEKKDRTRARSTLTVAVRDPLVGAHMSY
ncbi:MAG: hypothetical protein ACYDC0_16735, partial [Acidimicrobiales bacterium]